MAPRISFSHYFLIFNYFFKYETIETHARAFLAFIILAIGRVGKNLIRRSFFQQATFIKNSMILFAKK